MLDNFVLVFWKHSKIQNRLFQLEGTFSNHLVLLLDHFRADQMLKHFLRVFSKCLIKADRQGAFTTSSGGLSHYLASLSVKQSFLMSSPNLCSVLGSKFAELRLYQNSDFEVFASSGLSSVHRVSQRCFGLCWSTIENMNKVLMSDWKKTKHPRTKTTPQAK